MEEQARELRELLGKKDVSYIGRLQKDIKKLQYKRDRLSEFFANRATIECDQTQFKLLKEQGELMDQLLVVMKQRLDYELKIHPQIEDDANDCDEQETIEA